MLYAVKHPNGRLNDFQTASFELPECFVGCHVVCYVDKKISDIEDGKSYKDVAGVLTIDEELEAEKAEMETQRALVDAYMKKLAIAEAKKDGKKVDKIEAENNTILTSL